MLLCNLKFTGISSESNNPLIRKTFLNALLPLGTPTFKTKMLHFVSNIQLVKFLLLSVW